MKKKIIIMACAVVLLAGCGNPKLQDGKEVVASIKDKNITAEELYEELKDKYGTDVLINLIDEYIADKEVPTTDEINQKVNEQYESQKKQNEEYYKIDFEELLENYGYTVESYKKALLLSYKQEEMVKEYVKSTLTEEEIKKYYEDNMYGKITARHILIMPKKSSNMTEAETNQKKKEAYDLAVSLIKRLDNGEDFATLAKEFSDDTVSAENGGLLDAFDNKSGYVKEFWEASVNLEVGKYSKTPVESQYGYHIILKEKEEDRPNYDDAKENIKNTLAENKINEDSTNLIQKALYKAREKYNLKIEDEDINKVYEDSTKTLKD